jgi:GxxExxY protein
MKRIIYPKLSYKIIGLLFKIYNELGYGYQEKHYQKALKMELEQNNLKYRQEVLTPLTYQKKCIGRYFLDFLIEDKIAVELKIADDFYKKHLKQVLDYLKTNNLKLGIVALFTKDGLKYKRILNIKNS